MDPSKRVEILEEELRKRDLIIDALLKQIEQRNSIIVNLGGEIPTGGINDTPSYFLGSSEDNEAEPPPYNQLEGSNSSSPALSPSPSSDSDFSKSNWSSGSIRTQQQPPSRSQSDFLNLSSSSSSSFLVSAVHLDDIWYFGDVTRVEAESILTSCLKDSLLLRTSSIPGCYALSKYQHLTGQYAHLLVVSVGGGQGFMVEGSTDTQIYDTLSDLIERSPETTGFVPAGLVVKRRQYRESQELELERMNQTMTTKMMTMRPSRSGSNAVADAIFQPDPEEEKRERLRDRVIEEIILTEKDYANDLGVLVKHYLVPLSKKDAKIVAKEDVANLFSNISELLDINHAVLNSIQQRKRRKDQGGSFWVADVFLKMADDFKVYTVYCINHPVALQTLERLKSTNTAFVNFEKKALTIPETKALGLLGFLIKPVQRLTKYPLLMRELLKYTPESHVEYETVVAALDKVNQVVDYVNERKRMVENQQKLVEIKGLVDNLDNFELLKSTRMFILEMPVKKFVKKNAATDYQLFLFSDMLIYSKAKTNHRFKFKGRIYLDLLRVVDQTDNTDFKNAIQISDRNLPPEEEMVFCLPTEKDKRYFINECKKAVKEYYIENRDQLEAEANARQYLHEFKFKDVDPVKVLKDQIENKKRGDSISQPTRKASFGDRPVDIKQVVSKLPASNERIKAIARYDNFSAADGDLEFSKGDIVIVTLKHESGWWKGECGGLVGVFPHDVVEIVATSERPTKGTTSASNSNSMALRHERSRPSILPPQENSDGDTNEPQKPPGRGSSFLFEAPASPATPLSPSPRVTAQPQRALSPNQTPNQSPVNRAKPAVLSKSAMSTSSPAVLSKSAMSPRPAVKGSQPPSTTSSSSNTPITSPVTSPIRRTAPVAPSKSAVAASPSPAKHASAPPQRAPSSPSVMSPQMQARNYSPVPNKLAGQAPNRPAAAKRTYSYEVLRDQESRPADLDLDNLEKYLSEEEFRQLFKVTVADFEQLPPFRKWDQKQKLGLV